MGVITLMGMMPLSPGRVLTREQKSVSMAPIMMVDGMSMRWSDVRKSIRDRCGTAIPINDIGPQKAVQTDTKIPVTMRMYRWVLYTDIPIFAAYLSPRSNALRGFTIKTESKSASNNSVANSGIFSILTPPKLPIPHTMKECTPPSVAR